MLLYLNGSANDITVKRVIRSTAAKMKS